MKKKLNSIINKENLTKIGLRLKNKAVTYKKLLLLGVPALILLITVVLIANKPQPINDKDFTKGVLAINTDKSSYIAGDNVLFMMGSLDSKGETLCKSTLQLEIRSPKHKELTTLSTSNNEIITTPTCGENNVTNEPDYIARYTIPSTLDAGKYELILTNLDTEKKVVSSFLVTAQTNNLIISRYSAPRINPFKSDRYPMTITVKATQDTNGQLEEFVPSNFKIVWQGTAKTAEQNDVKKLTWDINIKAGESQEFRYEYQAPQVSPDFIKLGKAVVKSRTGATLFTESEYWRIASDANCVSAGTGNWSAITWTNCASGPQTTDSVQLSGSNTVTMDVDASILYIVIDSGSTLQFSGTRTLTMTSTTSGRTFIANSGTYTSNGAETITINVTTPAGNQTISSGTVQVYNLSVTSNLGAARTYSLGTAFGVTNNMTLAPSGTGNFVLTVNPTKSGTTAVGGTITLTSVGSSNNRVSLDLSTTGGRHMSAQYIIIGTNSTFRSRANTLTLTATSGTLFTRNGTYTRDTGTIAITSASGTPNLMSAATTFHILTINSAATVINANQAITIGNTAGAQLNVTTGVLNDSGYGITGPGGTNGTLTVSAGASLCLGGASTNTSATCDSNATSTSARAMPTFNAYSFNATSNMYYLSNAATTISGTPTYGNLILSPVLTANRVYTAGAAMTINGDFTIQPSGTANSLTFNPAGDITVAATKTTTITRSGSNATSSLDLRPSSTDYNLSTGLLNIATNGTLDAGSAASNITLTGTSTTTIIFTRAGTFTQGSSTVIFNGNGDINSSAALFSADTTLYNLSLTPTITAGRTYNIGVALSNIGGNFTINPTAASSLALTVNAGGNITVAATGTTTISGTTSGTSTLDLRPVSTDYNLSTGLLDIQSAGALDATSAASTITLTGTSGTLFTRSGTFTAGSSTVVFSGDGSPTALTSGTFTSGNSFNNLSLTPSISSAGRTYAFGSGALNINGNFTIQPTGTQLLTVNMAGDITVAATGTTTISRSSTATSILATGASNPTLSTGNLTIATGGTLNGTSSSSTITLTATSGTPLSLSGDNFTEGTTTVSYAPASGTANTITSTTYYNLTVNHTGTTFSLTTSGVTVTNDLTITAGVLDVVNGSNYPITVGRNWTNSVGTGGFTARNGTVTFNTTTTAAITGATTFYNFTSTTAGKTLQFGASTTFTINGLLTITGAAGPSFVTLTSTTGSSTWTINHQGTESITYASVSWGACDGSSTSITLDQESYDDGNNGVCWAFTPISYPTPHTSLPIPRLHWQMDEGAGSSVGDKSSQSNTGTITNATWQVQGDKPDQNKRSSYLHFDGIGDYVTRAFDADFNFGTASFAITGWVRHSQLISGTQTILSRATAVNGVGYKIYMDSSGHICFGIDASAGSFPNDSACTTQTYTDSTWHHFAGIKNGTTSISIYVDGRLGTTTTGITSGSLNGVATLYIGTDVDGSTNGWNGDIDNISFYPDALTENQIKTDILDPSSVLFGSNPTDVLANGLIGHWKMDSLQVPGNATDSSGSNYHLNKINGVVPGIGKFSTAGSFTAASSQYLSYAGGTMSLQPNGTYGIDVGLGSFLPDANGGTNDTMQVCGVGGTEDAVLLKFDLTHLPPEATVTGATLTLYVTSASSGTFTVHRILSANNAWTEMGATWNNQVGSTAWTGSAGASTSGTDFSTTLMGSDLATAGSHAVTLDLTEFGLMRTTNNGMRLFDTSFWCETFASSDNATAGNRPKLDITYTLPSSSALNVTGDMTMSAWINPSSNTGGTQYNIIGKWDGSNTSYQLAQYGSEFRLYLNSASNYVASTNASLTTGNWYHVTAVYEAKTATINLYLNGNKLTTSVTGTIPSSINSNAGAFHIGAQDSTTTATNFFNGYIDETRIYNRALSPAEVQQLYVYAPVPVGWWKMDENTGTTIYDSSGNGNTATATTGTPWTQGKIGPAISLNGSNQNVNAGTGASISELGEINMSVGTWVYLTNTPADWSQYGVIVKGNDAERSWIFVIYNIGGTVPRSVAAAVYDTGGSEIAGSATNFSISLNEWHYLSFTYDNSGTGYIKLYVDGVEATYNSQTNAGGTYYSDSATPLKFGSYSDDVGYFPGRIDDVKIYDYVRTSKQVVEDMNGGHPAGGSPIASQTAYWKLDEQQGQTINNSNPLNAITTMLGTTSGVDTTDPGWYMENNCKINGCLNFDGSDDLVTVTNTNSIDFDTNLHSGFTMSALIYPDGAGEGSGGRIFYKGTSTWLRVDTLSGGMLDIEASLDLVTTDATLNVAAQVIQSTWNHVALSYTDDLDDEITIWVNGKAVGTSAGGNGSLAATDTNDLLIGGDSSNNFDGRIDEIKIYNSELTAAEIRIDAVANSSSTLGGTLGTHNNEGFAGNPPVGWWKIDENTGTTANDSSGNNLTLSLDTGASFKSGKMGPALYGDNSSNTGAYRTDGTGSSLDLTGDLSLSFWMKATSIPSYAILISKGDTGTDNDNNYACWLMASVDRITCYVANGAARSTVDTTLVGFTPVINTWYHIEFVHTYAARYLYINGALINTTTENFTPAANNLDFTIGGRSNDFPGYIDDVKVYNYARTAAQIAYDYSRGAPIAWYKTDECTGGTIYNATLNSNGTQLTGYDGTINLGASDQTATGDCTTNANTPWYNGRTGKFGSSINLDGTDDSVSLGDMTFLESASGASWSFWANWDSLDLGRILMSKGNGSAVTQESWVFTTSGATANMLVFCIASSTTDACGNYGYLSNAFTQTGTWYHFVVAYDGTAASNIDRLKIYKNGQQMPLTGSSGYVGTIPASLQATTSNATIGTSSDRTTGTIFNGKIDDVRIYNEGSAIRFGYY